MNDVGPSATTQRGDGLAQGNVSRINVLPAVASPCAMLPVLPEHHQRAMGSGLKGGGQARIYAEHTACKSRDRQGPSQRETDITVGKSLALPLLTPVKPKNKVPPCQILLA